MVAKESAVNHYLALLAALGLMLALVTISHIVFRRYFAIDYFTWYVDAGPFIGLATGVFAAAWGGMDRNSGLVSSNPLDYCGACLQLLGLPTEVFGYQRTKTAPLVDSLPAIPMLFAFIVGALAWLVFIAPMQYFVFLLCGAPSRTALKANNRIYARFEGTELKYRPVLAGTAMQIGEWDASMKDKPVTLASGFSAALFFALGYVPYIGHILN